MMDLVFYVMLGGLAVLAVPVLIHLIMRQKPKTLPFPAFRFLLQRHRTNLRKLRLRHFLLLALRLLLLAGLCLALARPRLISDQLNLAADRPVAAVLVFDTSASMDYKTTGGPSRLDEAKKRGLELLDQLPAGSRVAVLDTAEAVPTGRGAWSANLAQARDRINGLRLREANQPVTARLDSAYRLFADLAFSREDDRGHTLPRLLVVFSDRTRACWDGAHLAALREAADRVPPPLERLAREREAVPGLVDLLGGLRAEVPPGPGQDYPEQALIELLKELRDKSASLSPESYPDAELGNLIAKTRGKLWATLGALGEAEGRVSEGAKEYHGRLTKAVRDALHGLRGVHQVFVDVGVAEPVNLGILDVELPSEGGAAAPRQVFSPDEKVLLKANVLAAGKDHDTTLVCRVGGKSVTRPVVVKAGETKPVPLEIDLRDLPPGPHHVEVRLAVADLLAADDVRYATVAVREPRKVLILTDAPDRVQLWKAAIEARAEARFRCTVRAAKEGAPDDLSSYQAVYLMSVAKPSAALWGALREYAENGGGVAVVPGGKETDLAAYNDDKAAAALLPGKLKGIVSQKDPGAPWAWEDDRVYQHPMLRPVRGWKETGRDDFIKLPRGATLYWEAVPSEGGSAVVRYADGEGRPAVLERRVGRQEGRQGRVLLFTTRLDSGQEPRWNDYMETVTSFCVVLPGLTTAYLAGDTDEPRLNFVAGRGVPEVRLPQAGRAPAYTLQGPGVLETVPAPEGANVLAFKDAVVSGNYVVEDRERARVGGFSVNLPPEETVLTQVPAGEIEGLFGSESVVPVGRSEDLAESLRGHWDQPFELLPLLLLLVLVVLAGENLLGNLFYRREAEVKEERPL